jgi:hypothetical protein
VSTAAATSPSAGYSSVRPTTGPRTAGSRRAPRHFSYAPAWSSAAAPGLAAEQQVVEDVGGGEDTVHAGAAQHQAEAPEQLGAVGHGERAPADAERAACRVARGAGQQPAVAPEQGPADAPGGGLGGRFGVPGAQPDRHADADGRDAGGGPGVRAGHPARPHSTAPAASAASISAGTGIAEEHSRREATMAPAALA